MTIRGQCAAPFCGPRMVAKRETAPTGGARRREAALALVLALGWLATSDCFAADETIARTVPRDLPTQTSSRPAHPARVGLKNLNHTRPGAGGTLGFAGEPLAGAIDRLAPRARNEPDDDDERRASPDGPRRARRAAVGPPKLVQWSREPVQYHEGSTLVLSCSLSYAGGEQAPLLKFAWFKQGKALVGSRAATGGPPASSLQANNERLSIESLADYSFLRLADLRPSDSGAYTCVVSNSLGHEDRTTTQVLVNVKLKWLPAGPTGEPQESPNSRSVLANGNQFEKVRAGQSATFECNAAGGGGGGGANHLKAPRVRWFRLVPAQQTTGQVHSAVATTSGLGEPSRWFAKPQQHVRALDETQLRASLLQADSPASPASEPIFHRLELINSVADNELAGGPEGGKRQQVASEFLGGGNNSALNSHHQQHHRNHQLRWRIETNSGSSSGISGPSQQHQQHETHSRLILDRLEPSASGLYECEVTNWTPSSANGPQSSLLESSSAGGGHNSGDKLKKLFGLLVNGK